MSETWVDMEDEEWMEVDGWWVRIIVGSEVVEIELN